MARLTQFAGSPDVFDLDTGFRQTEQQVLSGGGFGSVDVRDITRPGITQESQFAQLAGTNLSTSELQTLGGATQPLDAPTSIPLDAPKTQPIIAPKTQPIATTQPTTDIIAPTGLATSIGIGERALIGNEQFIRTESGFQHIEDVVALRELEEAGRVRGGFTNIRDISSLGTLGANITATPAIDPVTEGDIELPTPVALDTNEAFILSLQGSIDANRQLLEDRLKSELDALQSRVDASNEEIKRLTGLEEAVLGDAETLTQPFREELEKAERERLFINENFQANQALVNELDTLLTEGNALIEQMRAKTGLASIRNPRVNKTIENINARAGVISAVMNARTGQITQALTFIDRTMTAITADRNDQISYYNTLLDFYANQKTEEGKKLVSLGKDQKEFLTSQVALIEGDLAIAEANADYIKDLMKDPKTAEFMARAGVNLNMTPAEVDQAIANQTYTESVTALHKEQAEEGWEWIPTPAELRDLPVGVETKDVPDGRGQIHTYKRVAVIPKAPGVTPGTTPTGFIDESGNAITSFQAATLDANGNPDFSDEQLKAALLEKYTGTGIPTNQRLTISQINSIIETREQPQQRREDIRQGIEDAFFQLKDLGFERNEAKERMEAKVKESLGIKKENVIPNTFKEDIEITLNIVYGQGFFGRIFGN